ncbi:hypothetical protein ONA91_26085 [Micromonospora sp. DR5-3]|uniref:hypothetical protein n=1 Tax=unclassified Micromonospora TaxID=2617518 RepID=UPI0011DA9153|nr:MULTISPECIES: hypothetical protein [unclassified Micromonospora]MCW3817924.1 hypothetical protein [Micromonospora sp. DR5-3]TYC19251.1 hypothetical protein FXF52_37575 [Micromonospora sp. MP36]
MDVMLALTEDSVHEVLWTQALLADWERVIVRKASYGRLRRQGDRDVEPGRRTTVRPPDTGLPG